MKLSKYFKIIIITGSSLTQLFFTCVEGPCFGGQEYEDELYVYRNKTDKQIQLKAYSRHMPANYTAVDDQSQYIDYTVEWSDGKKRTGNGPTHIDSTLFLHSNVQIDPGDSVLYRHNLNTPEGRRHFFATFDYRYAYPQLDSIVIQFEDKKALSFTVKGVYQSKDVVYNNFEPDILQFSGYKSESILLEKTVGEGCSVYDLKNIYEITENHYKEAR